VLGISQEQGTSPNILKLVLPPQPPVTYPTQPYTLTLETQLT